MSGPDKVEYASLTDVGVRRSHNQDSHAVVLAADLDQWRQQGHIVVVADGMGGHAVGEMASDIAAHNVPLIYQKHAAEGPVAALRKAFTEANAVIHARGQQNPEFKGMGTTTTALILRPEGAWIGHVGDSRVYRIRGDRIEQLSFDHSRAWEVARRRQVDPDSVLDVRSNILIRSMGPEPGVQVDIEGPHPVKAGDIFVLCSDGLSGPLSDHEIGAVAGQLPPEEACQMLIDLANLRGGPDNITAVIVRALTPSEKTREKRPWRLPFPWPLAVSFLGVLLAAAAVVLTFYELPGGGLAFALALVAILGGLVGLFFYQRAQQRREEQKEQEYRPRTRTYRHASCKADADLVTKLKKAEAALRQMAQENNWALDWNVHQPHVEAAENHFTKSDLPAAFREYCRALRPLTEALKDQRQKEESFQPVWDKHG